MYDVIRANKEWHSFSCRVSFPKELTPSEKKLDKSGMGGKRNALKIYGIEYG